MFKTLQNLIPQIPEFWFQIITTAISAILIGIFILLTGIILIYLERKIAGHIQSRPGPLHVGPHGILQTLADGIKLIKKENLIPENADKILYLLAPIAVFLTTFLIFLIIPFDKNLQVADPNIGIFYIIAISGLTVISIITAGYSSNNKYSFLGSMRSAAQAISYEIPIIFSILGVIILSQSAKISEIIAAQQNIWFILLQPIAFLIFFIAAIAETNRTPFDLPEAESELVAGFHTEYSGMRFAIFFLAEYANIFIISAVAAILFFGGPSGPFLPGIFWFFIKTYILIFLIFVFRWTFPRLRFDQLLKFSWKFLTPLAIINLAITAIITIF